MRIRIAIALLLLTASYLAAEPKAREPQGTQPLDRKREMVAGPATVTVTAGQAVLHKRPFPYWARAERFRSTFIQAEIRAPQPGTYRLAVRTRQEGNRVIVESFVLTDENGQALQVGP